MNISEDRSGFVIYTLNFGSFIQWSMDIVGYFFTKLNKKLKKRLKLVFFDIWNAQLAPIWFYFLKAPLFL